MNPAHPDPALTKLDPTTGWAQVRQRRDASNGAMNTAPTAPLGRTLSRRGLLGGALASLAAAGGGTAWALDRFLVEHPEVTNASAAWASTATAASTTTSASASVLFGSQTSGTGSDLVTWFVADLRLSSGTALRSAFADDTFGANIIALPSVIASDAGASWAINGDDFGFRDSGIVLRNGVAFRDRGVRQGARAHP